VQNSTHKIFKYLTVEYRGMGRIREFIGFIKSLYKGNCDDFCKAIFGVTHEEMLDKITGNTSASMQFVSRILPEINQKLEQKGYVLKKVGTSLLTYDPVESPDFVVQSKGFRGFLQKLYGSPAELYIRGVKKCFYIKKSESAILPEMQYLASQLEKVIKEPVGVFLD